MGDACLVAKDIDLVDRQRKVAGGGEREAGRDKESLPSDEARFERVVAVMRRTEPGRRVLPRSQSDGASHYLLDEPIIGIDFRAPGRYA
jgi:hypothetical protein